MRVIEVGSKLKRFRSFILRLLSFSAAYVAAAALVIGLADILANRFQLPSWTIQLVIVLSALGYLLGIIVFLFNSPGENSEQDRAADGGAAKAPSRKNNLPAGLDAFVGRDVELRTARSVLSRHRLLTIAGFGGIGKTRLAIEVAYREASRSPDGVWFFRLDALSDGSVIPSTIARELGLGNPEQVTKPADLAAALQSMRALLVLDNCEHLLSACLALVSEVLDKAPHVKIIATSREPLHARGEQVLSLEGLPVPNGRTDSRPLFDNPSARLFLERCGITREHVASGAVNEAAVREICRRVDGNPLLLELAASWVETTSIEKVAADLSTLLAHSSSEHREATRHASLTNSLDWSYNLLSPLQRQALLSISIFVGSAPIDAIECVVGSVGVEKGTILQALSRLVRHRLLKVDSSGKQLRYWMLQPVQEYLKLHLNQQPTETDSLRERHANWYAELAEHAEGSLHGYHAAATIAQLDTDLENIRAAMAYLLREAKYPLLSRFAALHWYWFVRGLWKEAADVLEQMGARIDKLSQRDAGRVCLATGTIHWAAGSLSKAEPYLMRSEELFSSIGWKFGLAQAAHIRGHVLQQLGALDRALTVYEDTIKLWRAEQDPYWLGLLLDDVGIVAAELGDQARATEALTEALVLSTTHNDMQAQGNALMNLAVLDRRQGQFAAARERLEQAERIQKALGFKRGLGTALKHRADLCLALNDTAGAAGLLAEALTLQVEIGHINGIARSLESLSQLESSVEPAQAAYFVGGATRIRSDHRSPLTGISLSDQESLAEKLKQELGSAHYLELWSKGYAERKEILLDNALIGLSRLKKRHVWRFRRRHV